MRGQCHINNNIVFLMLTGASDHMHTPFFQNKLGERSKNGKSVDVFPYVCRATLDNMLRCSLFYDGCMQDNEEYEWIY